MESVVFNRVSNALGNVVVYDIKCAKPDLIFIALCVVNALWIIPVDFEHLLGRYFDIRNIVYLFLIFAIIPFLNLYLVRVNRNCIYMLLAFLIYFILEYYLAVYFNNTFKSMFFAVWMLLTIGAMFCVIGVPARIVLVLEVFCLCIAISVLFGLLISFFGEPFLSFRYAVIGVNPTDISDSNIFAIIREDRIGRVVGFCKSIFGFSYQLAALPVVSLALLVYRRKMHLKVLWGVVLGLSIIGMLANGERSSLLACISSIVMFYIMCKKSRKVIIGLTLAVVVLFCLVSWSENYTLSDSFILGERLTETGADENGARIFQQIAGLHTLLFSPLGNCYEEYTKIAFGYKFIREHYGMYVTAPHNHFITSAFRSGWLGITMMTVIGYYIIQCQKLFWKKAIAMGNGFEIIACGAISSLFAVVINSCFHNTGMFNAEPATVLLIGIIGAGACISDGRPFRIITHKNAIVCS